MSIIIIIIEGIKSKEKNIIKKKISLKRSYWFFDYNQENLYNIVYKQLFK